MRILGLDVGKTRTGVAFADDSIGFPLALDTVVSGNEADLNAQLLSLCDEREIDLVVIGLPLLPTGKEGTQSTYVRMIGDELDAAGFPVEYLDERYTTSADTSINNDANAACELLTVFLQRHQKKES